MADWNYRQLVGAGFGNTQTRVNAIGTALAYQSGNIWRSTDGGTSWNNPTSVFNGGNGTFVPLIGTKWSLANYPGRLPAISTDDGLNWADTFQFTAQSQAGAGNGAGEAVFGLANFGWGGWTTDNGVTWGEATGTWPFVNQPIAGSIIFDGTQYVYVDCDGSGGGSIYTAATGFLQGAGPTWVLVGTFSNGMGLGTYRDNLISYDPSTGYVVGGRTGIDPSVFISPTLVGLLTASGVVPLANNSSCHGVFAYGGKNILLSDTLGNLSHSSDGGVTWVTDNLNYPNVGEIATSITLDPAHHQVLAWGVQGSMSTLSVATTAEVPNIVGMTQADATAALLSVGLIIGAITHAPGAQPAGSVVTQNPLPGTVVAFGAAVSVQISDGLIPVPNVIGDSLLLARNTIIAAGLTPGTVTTSKFDSGLPPGTVGGQSPDPGTGVLPGSLVNMTNVSAVTESFDVSQTVISQYANSPTLLRLIDNMAEYIDPSTDFLNFFTFVWNVDTAVGFGLDIWGRIVGVSRVLPIAGSIDAFGFANTDSPPDWEPFNQGPFYAGNANTGAYTLPDDAYRTLILTKALANITATNAPALNQLVSNLFPGRGKCFVQDLGGMAMSYVFEFALTTIEYAILTQSGVLPHPAGVLVSVHVVPGAGFVGFAEAGVGEYQPFGFGQFFIPGE